MKYLNYLFDLLTTLSLITLWLLGQLTLYQAVALLFLFIITSELKQIKQNFPK